MIQGYGRMVNPAVTQGYRGALELCIIYVSIGQVVLRRRGVEVEQQQRVDCEVTF